MPTSHTNKADPAREELPKVLWTNGVSEVTQKMFLDFKKLKAFWFILVSLQRLATVVAICRMTDC